MDEQILQIRKIAETNRTLIIDLKKDIDELNKKLSIQENINEKLEQSIRDSEHKQ